MSTLNLHPVNKSEAPAHDDQSRAKRPYVELPGLRVETRDVLKQLDANIMLLEDLGGRLQFVLTELRSLIRR